MEKKIAIKRDQQNLNESVNDNIGHLGRLAQMCANYCREFDEIIEAASLASTLKYDKQVSSDRNLEYLSRGFKNLKRKFRENEMMERLESNKKRQNSDTAQFKKVTSPKLTHEVDDGDDDDDDEQHHHQPCAQRTPLPVYSCFWKIGGTSGQICGKIFATNEELNDHFKFHTTTELLSDFDFYFRTKHQLYQNKIN